MIAVINTTINLNIIPPVSNQLYKIVNSLKQKNEPINHNKNPIK
jgi:hypothetical protein